MKRKNIDTEGFEEYSFKPGEWVLERMIDRDSDEFTSTAMLSLREKGGGAHYAAISVYCEDQKQINALLKFLNSSKEFQE